LDQPKTAKATSPKVSTFPVSTPPGKIRISELKADHIELLMLRTEVQIAKEHDDICLHHLAAYGSHYGGATEVLCFEA